MIKFIKFIEILRNLCMLLASIAVLSVICLGILMTNQEIKILGQISVVFMSGTLLLEFLKHFAITFEKDSK